MQGSIDAVQGIGGYIGLNQLNQGVWYGAGDEFKNRNNFYDATKIIDAAHDNLPSALQTGQGRADLINFLTDGTLPSDDKNGKKNQSDYSKTLMDTGMKLMKENNIPVRKETSETYNQINTKQQ